jgi:putative oxidoreductase
MKTLALLFRLGLGALWIYAGVMKLRDPQQFFEDVHNFRITSWDVSMIIAIYLPWLEALVGAALILRLWSTGAAALSCAMTLVFLAAILSAWARGLDISCGCFGHDDANRTNYPLHVAMNLALLAASTALLWMETRVNARPAAPAP